MSYYDQLHQDLVTLSVVSDSPYRPYVSDYKSMVAYVENLSHSLKPHTSEVEETNLADLSTDFARRALFLAKAEVEFDDTYEDCCSEAEPKLLDALAPSMVANPAYKSPIIVTKDNEPVAVVKRYGVNSLYGIKDVPEHHIVRGAFHGIDQAHWAPLDLPASSEAWAASIEEGVSPVAIVPVRFSIFNIPVKEREHMAEFENADEIRERIMARSALCGTEEKIADLARQALDTAKPIAPLRNPAPLHSV